MTPLDNALALRRLGFSVFLIPAPQPGVAPGQPGDGKVPAMPRREYQTRLPTDDELRAWFSEAAMNVAVVTGWVSGTVVIDADDWLVSDVTTDTIERLREARSVVMACERPGTSERPSRVAGCVRRRPT